MKELINELNEVRNNQKSIKDFSNVADFLNHVKMIATQKADILARMQQHCINGNMLEQWAVALTKF